MIALLGDLHVGVKRDDQWTHDNIKDFFKWFVADCKSKNITTLLQTGDWFDVRKGVSQVTLKFMRDEILPLLYDQFEKIIVVVGNHDMHVRNSVYPNSLSENLGLYNQKNLFTIIEEPTTINIDGLDIDFIPWVCAENQEKIFKFIKKSKSQYCMGHWELTGFYFYKGLKSTGMEPDILKKYKGVWSGHFHTISNNFNIQYLGTPYTITAGDSNDPRGYWTFDISNETLSFFENPVMNHYKLFYDGKKTINAQDYTNKSVVLVVQNDDNYKELDILQSELERVCHEFRQEDKVPNNDIDYDDDIEHVNVMDIVYEEIEKLNEDKDIKEHVKNIMNGLYAEANSMVKQ